MAKVKICGISHESEINIMNELVPDFIGFVFWSKSKRFIAPEHAGVLKSKLRKGIKAVGVFRNASLETLAMCVETAGLDLVQLHGDETGEYIASLREYIRCPIIKAFKVSSIVEAERAMRTTADYALLDGGAGEGKTFNWSFIGTANRRNYFLAGGLTPLNVNEALSITPQPYCLDVSSGVEANRLKDYRKCMQFIYAVRNFKRKQ